MRLTLICHFIPICLGRTGQFLGCSNFPKCKGTREAGEATLEKITAVTANR